MPVLKGKLKISRTSLRNYRDRAESLGISMIDLLNFNDAELQALMHKKEGHRTRDVARYAFLQENVEENLRLKWDFSFVFVTFAIIVLI